MSQLFLKTLAGLETDLLDSDSNASDSTKKVLRRLVQFVEQGDFSESEVEHFILANFRLSSSDITDKWNKIHFEKKTSNTFRGQISGVNSYLVSLFGVGASELNDAFITGDKKVLQKLVDIMDAVEVGDFNITTRFPFISQGYLPDDETSSEYAVSDCMKEIQLLKSLDIRVIDEMIRQVDMDKLIFVLQAIREPLIVNEYVKRGDKSSKLKVASLNKRKLEFNKAFNVVKPKALKPVSEIEGKETEGSRVVYKEIEKLVEVPEKIPYNLGITKEMADVLTRKVLPYEQLSTEEKKKAFANMDEDIQKKCETILGVLTPEGLAEALSKVNPCDLAVVLEGYLKK